MTRVKSYFESKRGCAEISSIVYLVWDISQKTLASGIQAKMQANDSTGRALSPLSVSFSPYPHSIGFRALCMLGKAVTSGQNQPPVNPPTTFRQLRRSGIFFFPQNGLLKLAAFQEVKRKTECHDLKRKTRLLCKIVRSHCRQRQRPVVSLSWKTFVEDFPRETQVLLWLFSRLYSSSEMGKIEWPSDHYL